MLGGRRLTKMVAPEFFLVQSEGQRDKGTSSTQLPEANSKTARVNRSFWTRGLPSGGAFTEMFAAVVEQTIARQVPKVFGAGY